MSTAFPADEFGPPSGPPVGLPPVPAFDSPEAAARLSAWLQQAGFTWPGVLAHLGLPAGGRVDLRQMSLWAHRTRPGREIDVLIRWFILGRAVSEPAARGGVADALLAALKQAGLVRREGVDSWAPAVRFYGTEAGWLCADLPPLPGQAIAPHYVMGLAASTQTLIRTTARRPVRRFLDLGCGCGTHAILAARHAREVYAVDLNPRAIAFTRFNAALHGLHHLEARVGDRFGPVEGLEFDQIVSNPPFVVSPGKSLVFRDGGEAGDSFFRSLVRDSVRYLAPGGLAQFLGNWVVADGQTWREASHSWLDDLPAHVWVLCSDVHPLDEYVGFWITHTEAGSSRELEARLEQWVGPLADLGVSQVAAGSIQLCRTTRSHPWRRFESAPPLQGSPGEDIRERFDLVEQVLCAGPAAWMQRCPKLPAAVRLHQVSRQEGTGWISDTQELVKETGLEARVPVDPVRAAFLGRCHGRAPLADLVREFAEALEESPADVTAHLLPWLDELMARGLLELEEARP